MSDHSIHLFLHELKNKIIDSIEQGEEYNNSTNEILNDYRIFIYKHGDKELKHNTHYSEKLVNYVNIFNDIICSHHNLFNNNKYNTMTEEEQKQNSSDICDFRSCCRNFPKDYNSNDVINFINNSIIWKLVLFFSKNIELFNEFKEIFINRL